MSLASAVAQERARNARLLNTLRFAGVSAFYALFVVFGAVLQQPAWQGGLLIFTVYFGVSALIFFAARRNARVAEATSLGIALVDVPIIFFLQWKQFPTSNAGGVAGFNIGIYVFLIVLATLGLQTWRIFFTAAVAAVFEGALQYLAGISVGAIIATAILVGLAAYACDYASRRLQLLIKGLIEEEERRGRMAKLASIGQMAGSIGHDLRNPLTIIQLAAEHASVHAGEAAREAFATIDREIAVCTAITTRLLDFASERPLKLTPVALAPLLSEIDSVARVRLPGHVMLLSHLAPALPPFLQLDRDLFRQALVNLIQNAGEAIPSEKKGTVELLASVEGNDVVIAIKDNGSGIPEAIRSRIFDPLFTTKKSGNGFGLAIVNNIVTRLDGQLTFDTRENVGTTFTVRFAGAAGTGGG